MSLREVLIDAFYSGKEEVQHLNVPIRGKFHRWADGIVYLSEQHYSRTFAIVEDQDGKIYNVPPQLLKFVEPFEIYRDR